MINALNSLKDAALNAAFNLKIIPVKENGDFLTVNSLLPNAGLDSLTGAKPAILQYNPQSFSVKEDANYEQKQEQGAPGNDPEYKGIKPREFSIEFMIDSTGLFTPLKLPVNLHVALFRSLTTVPDPTTHRPNRLIVQYGTFISSCNMMSSEVTYSLFDSQGLPLRAKVKASFQETKDTELNKVARFFSSPDVTHEYKVENIDENLSYIAYKTYKTPNFYIAVAKANAMKTFRKLAVETKIFLPPISAK
jgi:Contractile injection system tube protein